MLFIELPAFVRQDLFDDDGLRAVQSRLLEDPEAGDLIRGDAVCVSYAQRCQVAVSGVGRG